MNPMLLRDSESGDENVKKAAGAEVGPDGGDLGGDEVSLGAEGPVKKKLPTSTILLGAIIIAAGGGLFAMRKLGLGPSLTFGDTRTKLEVTEAPSTEEHRRVLRDLTTSAIVAQVPAEEVQRNPFAMDEAFDGMRPTTGPAAMDPAEAARLEAERIAREQAQARKNQITQELGRLKLNSVVGGSRPVARISDRNYRLGETVAGLFELVEIGQRSVTLEVDGTQYTIEMGL